MKEFVIERTNEMRREWWNGTDWTDDDSQAKWYEFEPDAPKITEDENARAVRYETGTVAN